MQALSCAIATPSVRRARLLTPDCLVPRPRVGPQQRLEQHILVAAVVEARTRTVPSSEKPHLSAKRREATLSSTMTKWMRCSFFVPTHHGCECLCVRRTARPGPLRGPGAESRTHPPARSQPKPSPSARDLAQTPLRDLRAVRHRRSIQLGPSSPVPPLRRSAAKAAGLQVDMPRRHGEHEPSGDFQVLQNFPSCLRASSTTASRSRP